MCLSLLQREVRDAPVLVDRVLEAFRVDAVREEEPVVVDVRDDEWCVVRHDLDVELAEGLDPRLARETGDLQQLGRVLRAEASPDRGDEVAGVRRPVQAPAVTEQEIPMRRRRWVVEEWRQ